MMQDKHRRDFIKASSMVAATGAMIAKFGRIAKASASERVRVGIVGAGGRAMSLIESFSANKSVEVVAIADLDSNRLPKGLEAAAKSQDKVPRGESDFRKLIDDKSIDALVVGTPDHWHAIPTILACQAGKDVYVEKPLCQTPQQGVELVEAEKRTRQIVPQL